MRDGRTARKPERAAVIAAVLLCHIAVLYGVIAWIPTVETRAAKPVIGQFQIVHIKRPPVPVPRELFAAMAAPTASFIPPPDIQVKTLATLVRPKAAEHVIENAGFTQVAGTGSHAEGGRMSPVKTPPVFLGAKPDYPPTYRDSGRQGYVSVVCMIHADGRPGYCEAVDVQGGRAFGNAVLSWLQSGRVLYEPATLNGKATNDLAILKVYFNERGDTLAR